MVKPWETKEWKENREKYLQTHGRFCDWCFSEQEPFTIDHKEPTWSQSREDYMNLVKVQVLCKRCSGIKYFSEAELRRYETPRSEKEKDRLIQFLYALCESVNYYTGVHADERYRVGVYVYNRFCSEDPNLPEAVATYCWNSKAPPVHGWFRSDHIAMAKSRWEHWNAIPHHVCVKCGLRYAFFNTDPQSP